MLFPWSKCPTTLQPIPRTSALGAELEAGERTHARVAGDELVQPWLEHASLGEVVSPVSWRSRWDSSR